MPETMTEKPQGEISLDFIEKSLRKINIPEAKLLADEIRQTKSLGSVPEEVAKDLEQKADALFFKSDI